MPGKLKVKVVAGRGLPVMDRSTDLADAFVEVKFDGEVQKTDVYKKSLNPQWNSEWFKFEVEDEALQDEPLELRILDHDTYSAHDAIGKVYIDLNPLLIKDNPSIITGWFPIYDTMHGIRGELNVIVKVDLFSDFNKFRQSSCGIQFFCTAEVPAGFRLQFIHGFVEELVVNDDPEYKWIDKIRTPRASNEARQRLFSKLSGALQRKIGLKVLEMAGNAVIGYSQCFDLEGESGIVVRGIGTAVTLSKLSAPPVSPSGTSPLKDSPLPEDTVAPSSPPNQVLRSTTSPVKVSLPTLNRRSSDSDISSNTPPKGSSLTGSSGSGSGAGSGTKTYPKPCSQQVSIDLLEFPFFTMKTFPHGFIVHLGGVVSARSVKLLDKIHNPEEPETRDAWWTEIRTEIRSHMRAMGCHAVIGYTEQTSICDEIIVLSASGTAAKVNVNMDQTQHHVTRPSPQLLATASERHLQMEKEKDKEKKLFVDVNLANEAALHRHPSDGYDENSPLFNCAVCHIPYKAKSSPFPVNLTKCAICRRRNVPDILFTTINPPAEIQTLGKGAFIQARVCRGKADSKSEASAKEIGDILPFLEYELHNQLVNKLKIRGMNGLFGLKIQISVGENMIVGIATATGTFFAALPVPPVLKILSQVTSEEENLELQQLQKRIAERVQKNKDIYELHGVDVVGQPSPRSVVTDDSDDEASDLELSSGNKDTFILEVDDAKDEAIAAMLQDCIPPTGIELCNTQTMPGRHANCLLYNLQMFTQVWRREVLLDQRLKHDFTEIFESMLRRLFFKLRRMTPCCLADLNFNVDVPDEDEVQITLNGICIAVDDTGQTDIELPPSSTTLLKPASSSSGETEDMMFQMEGISEATGAQVQSKVTKVTKPDIPKRSSTSQIFSKYKGGVELTSLPYVPGGRIERYLGSYNFFFIRETTSLREMGGLCGFIQSFIAEVLAIVRANVSALGGNALVAYRMTECELLHNPHKNQSQCLINVYGDVVCLCCDGDLVTQVPEPIRKHSDSPLYIQQSSLHVREGSVVTQ